MNSQARLGAFVLLALILLGFATQKVGDINLFKQDTHLVEAEFDDLMGLDLQSPVRMAGVKIGVVQDIFLRNNKAIVTIALNPDVRLPASTRASIIGRGLVGEKNLALSAKAGDTEMFPEGAVIPSDPAGDINTFMAKTSGITDNIQDISIQGERVLHDIADMLDENRVTLKETLDNLHSASRSIDRQLPATLDNMSQASSDLVSLIAQSKGDIHRSLHDLPGAIEAGKRFFTQADETILKTNALLDGNRENIYRMLFELRRSAENLEAMTDDLRRNPWKLTNKQREVPPSPRVQQEKMEEMMLSTGQMGLAPARR